jgi:hypothetical protein
LNLESRDFIKKPKYDSNIYINKSINVLELCKVINGVVNLYNPIAPSIICHLCDTSFSPSAKSMRNSLSNHLIKKHSIKAKFTFSCRFCNDILFNNINSSRRVTLHIAKEHKRELLNYNNNIAIISNDLPFKCKICNVGFMSRKSCTNHETTHKQVASKIKVEELRTLRKSLIYSNVKYTCGPKNNYKINNITLEEIDMAIPQPTEIIVMDTPRVDDIDINCIDRLLHAYSNIDYEIITLYIRDTLLYNKGDKYLYIDPKIYHKVFNFNAINFNVTYDDIWTLIGGKDTWEFAIFPINLTNNHWILILINRHMFNVQIIDPKGENNIDTFSKGLRRISDALGLERCKFIIEKSHPVHNDGYNCGTHICLAAKLYIDDSYEEIIYDTENMLQHRFNIHNEIQLLFHAKNQKMSRVDVNISQVGNIIYSDQPISPKINNKAIKQKKSPKVNNLNIINDLYDRLDDKRLILPLCKDEPDNIKSNITLLKNWMGNDTPDWLIFENIVNNFIKNDRVVSKKLPLKVSKATHPCKDNLVLTNIKKYKRNSRQAGLDSICGMDINRKCNSCVTTSTLSTSLKCCGPDLMDNIGYLYPNIGSNQENGHLNVISKAIGSSLNPNERSSLLSSVHSAPCTNSDVTNLRDPPAPDQMKRTDNSSPSDGLAVGGLCGTRTQGKNKASDRCDTAEKRMIYSQQKKIAIENPTNKKTVKEEEIGGKVDGEQRFSCLPQQPTTAGIGTEAHSDSNSYSREKKKTFVKICGEANDNCNLPTHILEDYFKLIYRSNKNKLNVDELGQLIGENFKPNTFSVEDLEITSYTLLTPVTRGEVMSLICERKDTCPGDDSLKYSDLLKLDPNCTMLTSIINICIKFNKIPQSWKQANIVLLYKKGDKSDISNWRPIAIMNTLYKVYTNILARRLTKTCKFLNIISPEQKGFMPESEGCLENIYLIDETIHKAKSNNENLALAWLDLANAFGSISHELINLILNKLKLPKKFCNIIADLYENAHCTILSSQGKTNPIKVESGVKQGDPLSPILFNICMELIIRTLLKYKSSHGFKGRIEMECVQAFADDLLVKASNSECLQFLLDETSTILNKINLKCNTNKCATLTIKGPKILSTQYKFDMEDIPKMDIKDNYNYLGKPIGMGNCKCPTEMISRCMIDIMKIKASTLLPWQMIDAIKTFIVPRIGYLARCATISVTAINELNKLMTTAVKDICYLPSNACNHYVYGHVDKGCLGILNLNDEIYIQGVTNVVRLLTSPDLYIKNLAWSSLNQHVSKWINRPANKDDLITFLNGDSSGSFCKALCNNKGDTVWNRGRKSCKQLSKTIECNFTYNENLGLNIKFKWNKQPCFLDSSNRNLTYKALRQATQYWHATELLKKYTSQGRNMESVTHSPITNKYILNGVNIRVCDWKFIHKAKLNMLQLRGKQFIKQEDRKCRRCAYPIESTTHVLNKCAYKKHEYIKKRHDQIQDTIVKQLQKVHPDNKILVDKVCNNAGRQVRPDIIIINEKDKKVFILDITCPSENTYENMTMSRTIKKTKYGEEVMAFRKQGYSTYIDAMIIGTLGSWYHSNDEVLLKFGLTKKIIKKIRIQLIGDTISYSKDKYWAHILGDLFIPNNFKRLYNMDKNIINNKNNNIINNNLYPP